MKSTPRSPEEGEITAESLTAPPPSPSKRPRKRKKLTPPRLFSSSETDEEEEEAPREFTVKKKKATTIKKAPKPAATSSKKKKKKRKVTVQLSDSSSDGRGAADSESEEIINPNVSLKKAMKKKTKAQGCWDFGYEALHSSELMFLEEMGELVAGVYDDLGMTVKFGGSAISKFNKKICKGLTRFNVLKKSFNKRKGISKEERESVDTMIEQSIEFLTDFRDEYSPINNDGAAISGLITTFEEDDIGRCLIGKDACNRSARKLKSLVKNNKTVANASWAALSSWKVGSRGFGQSSSAYPVTSSKGAFKAGGDLE